MIKECRVLLNNAAVTVVHFEDKDVQLPPIGRRANSLMVKFENGKYEVVNNEEKKKEQPKTKRQVRKKPVKEVEE